MFFTQVFIILTIVIVLMKLCIFKLVLIIIIQFKDIRTNADF